VQGEQMQMWSESEFQNHNCRSGGLCTASLVGQSVFEMLAMTEGVSVAGPGDK
jgi:hypothetical protein